ncbi:MAG: LysR family transcriptional regulator [Asticcacaulis sp.]|nr:LysR family transcriptional regulator [Asticcacaulis sp.]
MADPDLNLLPALDVLLAQRSVTAAAKVLRLSPSAMSRTLSRLRVLLGDPLLVPAGRIMVLTPHAEAIADRVRTVTADIQAVLRPAPDIDMRWVKRIFTLRANEAFVLAYGARLHQAVSGMAPDVRLRFAPKPDKDIRSLREGQIDLDIGVISGDGAELRAQTLYRDRFVGVVRTGHPLLSGEGVTAERYSGFGHVSDWGHVVAARSGHFTGPVDDALNALGISRDIKVVVPSFPGVVAMAAASDLIGLVPRSFADTTAGIAVFDLPVETPEIVISQIWHPRMDADPGHRWLRGVIHDAFRTTQP